MSMGMNEKFEVKKADTEVQKAQGGQNLGRLSAQRVGWIGAHVPRTSVTSSNDKKGALEAPSLSTHIHLGRGQKHS